MKRFASIFVVSAFIVSLLIPCYAHAANTGTTFYSFTFNGSLQNTSTRYKENTSSAYMNCTSMLSGKQYVASVQARASASAPSEANINVNSKAYYFNPGSFYAMHNRVRESGYMYAGIRSAQVGTNLGYSASGYWAPDSNRFDFD